MWINLSTHFLYILNVVFLSSDSGDRILSSQTQPSPGLSQPPDRQRRGQIGEACLITEGVFKSAFRMLPQRVAVLTEQGHQLQSIRLLPLPLPQGSTRLAV